MKQGKEMTKHEYQCPKMLGEFLCMKDECRCPADDIIHQPICPECHQPRLDDERVENNMRCGACAYG